MSKISSPSKRLLTLSLLSGVGPASLRKAIAAPNFEQLKIEEIATYVSSIHKALTVPSAWEIANELAEEQLREAEKHDARIISVLDAEYPKLLAETKDDPFILYVQGVLSASPEKSVAIIGTREPTAHGEIIAARVSQFFSERHWSIVSGLALGCDGIAHQAALDCGGHTVAVLAHGLQMISPSKHKKLAENILASGGALVTEYPFGKKVQKQQYVKRDLTQAGMAQGVVMIQSDLKGGSLYASRAALAYKRWLAVPYPTAKDLENNERKVQANLLISDGPDSEKEALLRSDSESLKRILILKSRDDYLMMLDASNCRRDAPLAESSPPPGGMASHRNAYHSSETTQQETHPNASNEPQLGLGLSTGEASTSGQAEQAAVEVSSSKATREDIAVEKKRLNSNVFQPSHADLSDALRDFSNRDTQLISEALRARLRHAQFHLDAVKLACEELPIPNKLEGLPHHIFLHVDDYFFQITHSVSIFLAIEDCRKDNSSKSQLIQNLIDKEHHYFQRDIHHNNLVSDSQIEQGFKLLNQLDRFEQLSSHRLILGKWANQHYLNELNLDDILDEPRTEASCISQMLDCIEEMTESFNTMIERVLGVPSRAKS